VPELQAHATGLPYLGYLLSQSQEAALLAHEGVCQVRIPLPERFALHKLLISQLRGARDTKSLKDVYQAAILLAALGDRYPGAIEEAVSQLPDSGIKYVRKALLLIQPQLEEAYPRAWDELTSTLG